MQGCKRLGQCMMKFRYKGDVSECEEPLSYFILLLCNIQRKYSVIYSITFQRQLELFVTLQVQT